MKYITQTALSAARHAHLTGTTTSTARRRRRKSCAKIIKNQIKFKCFSRKKWKCYLF